MQDALRHIYPDLDFRTGCLLQDDGDGVYISAWLDPRPQPTVDEIAAAERPAKISIITESIKADRDRRKGLGCTVGPHRFHSDDPSRIQQLGLVLMGAGMPAGIEWKTMDGTFADMTPTLAVQIFQAQAARDMALFRVCEQHIAKAKAADDPLAYDYSAGWPD